MQCVFWDQSPWGGLDLIINGIGHDERCRAEVGCPELVLECWEFSWRQVLTVVCVYAPNGSSECPAFLESLAGVHVGALVGDAIFVLEELNAHMGCNSVT